MQKVLDLKTTLNLPQTSFSMKANLPRTSPSGWRNGRRRIFTETFGRRGGTPHYSLSMTALLTRMGASIWEPR